MNSYVATIGFFDGVHLGHRYVLGQLVEHAKRLALTPMVITFSEHPRSVLYKDIPQPLLLNSLQERVSLIRTEGVERIVVVDFMSIRTQTAEQFMKYMHSELGVEVLLMGYDHRFGSDKMTDFLDYQRVAERVGISLLQLNEFEAGNIHVSSTAIRRLLAEGNILEANRLLGYDYMLTGKVVHGKGLGRQLGFPTANIDVDQLKLIPKDGVYSVKVQINTEQYPGMLNIGTNPTVNGNERTLEVHILGYDAELYGKTITLTLRKFIREEQRFSSIDELTRQISADMQTLNEQ